MLCIVPKLVARNGANTEGSLVAVAPPIDVPDFDIQLVYRKGKHLDDKNRHLREVISQAVEIVIDAG